MSETIWLDFAIPVISIIIGVVLGLMIAAIMRANDKAIEYGDTEHEFAESLVQNLYEARKDLHEARNVARDYRDLYAAEIDESIAAFPFPWEDEHGADRDGC